MVQGTIDEKPALLLAERAAFASDDVFLTGFSTSVANIKNLGDNDVYRWYLASTSTSTDSEGRTQPPDLKINLIYPCTDSHIKKYTSQPVRVVTETPAIYATHIRPYMARKREEGRLNWVFNIIEGRTEQENVLYRSDSKITRPDDQFLLLPDLNWDRETLGSLHLLALVERRDLWSVRDLKKGDAEWLRSMRRTLVDVVEKDLYKGKVEGDMLKFYVHCKSRLLTCLRDAKILWTTLTCNDYRPAHVLSLPHPHRPRRPRGRRYTGHRQSART